MPRSDVHFNLLISHSWSWSFARYNTVTTTRIDSVWYSGTPRGLCTRRKVVPGRSRLPSSPSHFLPSVYMKISCPCLPSQNVTLTGSRMLYMSSLVPVRRRKNQPKCLYGKKLSRPPGSPYLQSEWPSTQSHPAPRANFSISRVNGSLLFIKKCPGWLDIWRVTLLPGTTSIHVNRP